MSSGLGELSMGELFLMEAQTQGGQMSSQLLELEKSPGSPALLQSLMRSAHSIKGAARIVNLPSVVSVSHAMEDCFVAVQKGGAVLHQQKIDLLLSGVDLILRLARAAATSEGPPLETGVEVAAFLEALAALDEPPGPVSPPVESAKAPAPASAALPTLADLGKAAAAARERAASANAEVDRRLKDLDAVESLPRESAAAELRAEAHSTPSPIQASLLSRSTDDEIPTVRPAVSVPFADPSRPPNPVLPTPGQPMVKPVSKTETAVVKAASSAVSAEAQSGTAGASGKGSGDRFVRVSSENMNRLMGLAGESKVHSRWVPPFSNALQRLKRQQGELAKAVDQLREVLAQRGEGEFVLELAEAAKKRSQDCQRLLSAKLAELEIYDRRQAHVAASMYDAALACRMRPFSDGAQAFPRMVRDLGRALNKRAAFELRGANTRVDRDILEKLDAPITHLLRNAVDHGIESPDVRRGLGKSEDGVIYLEARHSAGMLLVVVGDDGCGIDVEQIRAVVVRKGLSPASTAERLSEAELLEFLFLPGFSMKDRVTEISGRGVGLDVVRDMVKGVRGKVRVLTQPGRGSRFQLELPLTLSVIRVLMVEIGGEPCAFPLAGIGRTARVSSESIAAFEGRPVVALDGRLIGLVNAAEILGVNAASSGAEHCLIVLERGADAFAVVVDRFLGEREVVVHPLDPRLGKVHDISAGTILDDGTPALIVDVEDMIHSIEARIAGGGLRHLSSENSGSVPEARRTRRVLVVDDSLTVRELERKLLEARGYEVVVAVDGREGWSELLAGDFDLVITDVDMPRMDGIELVTTIKRDPKLASLPVMIVSYKDREEDKQRGLEAGADYYLGKGSFHDQTLVNAVLDLIGPPH